MRLTVNLDEDLYQFARTQAFTERVSISQVVNAMIRQGLEPGLGEGAPRDRPGPAGVLFRGRRRFPVSRGARRITSDDVERLGSGEGEGGAEGLGSPAEGRRK